MGAPADRLKTVPEPKAPLTRTNDAFAEGTKPSQRIQPWGKETVNILNGAGEKPLAACVDYYYYRGGVGVGSDFRSGLRARVVVVGKDGKPEIFGDPVDSVAAGAELAKKNNKQLYDATLLTNTAFIEEHLGELLIFSSKNALTLTGGEKFTEDYYLVSDKEKKGERVRIADTEVLLREDRQRLATVQKEIQELQASLEAKTAEAKKLKERIPKIEAKAKEIGEVDERGTELTQKKKKLEAELIELVRN